MLLKKNISTYKGYLDSKLQDIRVPWDAVNQCSDWFCSKHDAVISEFHKNINTGMYRIVKTLPYQVRVNMIIRTEPDGMSMYLSIDRRLCPGTRCGVRMVSQDMGLQTT